MGLSDTDECRLCDQGKGTPLHLVKKWLTSASERKECLQHGTCEGKDRSFIVSIDSI